MRGALVVIGLLLGGSLALLLMSRITDAPALATRPRASGELGILRAYGLEDDQPVALTPRRLNVLARPQRIAFQFTAEGTGPRFLRITLVTPASRWVMHQARVETPCDPCNLEYILAVDEDYGDHLTLLLTVEAPHDRTVTAEVQLQMRR